MQKLITVYLDNSSYDKGTLLGRSGADKHGIIEECLSEYLNDGWKVIQLMSSAEQTSLATLRVGSRS